LFSYRFVFIDITKAKKPMSFIDFVGAEVASARFFNYVIQLSVLM